MRILALIAVIASLAVAAGFTTQGRSAADARRPNIVLILTDDFSWNLVKYMPQVLEMQKRGVTFSRFFVSDSLCCPSRAPRKVSRRFPAGREDLPESALLPVSRACLWHGSGSPAAACGKRCLPR